MTSFRRRIDGGLFVVAEQVNDSWRVDVVDVRSEPIADEAIRAAALRNVLDELSSLRGHIYHEELGNPRPKQ